MNVLYLSPGCFDKGGISRYNRFQISALRELLGEDSVTAISLSPEGSNDFEESIEVAWKANSPSHSLNKLTFAAISTLYALKPRIRIVWAAHVHLAPMARVIASTIGARAVVNVYGLELWSGLGRLRRWGLGSADAVVSDCQFSARYLSAENGLNLHHSATVIHDAVDIQKLTPGKPAAPVLRKYGIPDPDAHINILTLGRMVSGAAHKGYQRLLEAFGLVAPDIANARLIFAGSGDLVDRLNKRTAELGLERAVVFAGSIADPDLADVYRSSHIFSLVSDRGHERGEGVPVTPIEAAACRVPAIVGDEDGSPEAV